MCANSSDRRRASKPIDHAATGVPGVEPGTAPSPAAARVTTAAFIPAGPARSGPRSPAVPNVSGPANRPAQLGSTFAGLDQRLDLGAVAGVRVVVGPGPRRGEQVGRHAPASKFSASNSAVVYSPPTRACTGSVRSGSPCASISASA